MSTRRLSVPSTRDSGRRLLGAIPAPLQGQGRSCSLAHVLEIAYDYLGLRLSYNAIMALSGLAMRTPRWPGDPEPSREEWLAALGQLSQALGLQASVLGAEATPQEGEVMEYVVAAIDRGLPCVAFGWGSVKDHWSIITGYDRSQNALAGHCLLEEPRQGYELWPPELALLMAVSPDLHLPEDPAQAVAAAAAVHDPTLCRAWAEAVRDPAQPLDATYPHALHLLADARSAAAGFLQRLADSDDTLCGQWLAVATSHLYELVDLVEAATAAAAPLLSAGPDPVAADREDLARRLEAIASLDELAFTALQQAPDAEFPPEEEEF